MVLCALFLIAPALYLLLHDAYSPLAVILVTAALITTWSINKTWAIVLFFSFLVLLGDIRRIVAMYANAPANDPLLVISPILAGCAAVPILLKARFTGPLAKTVLALTVLMTLEIFNPRQGSFSVGLAGALFFITPVLCFWVGRTYATEHRLFIVIYHVILPLGILAAVLGLYQTYVGFLPWEKIWIAKALESGYTALGVGGGHIRSFGFSPNSVEYGNLLLLTEVFLAAAIFAGKRYYVVFLPLVLTAQLLASQRSQILRLLLTLALLWAVRGRDYRLWIPRLLLAIPLGFGLLFYSAAHSSSEDLGKTASTADYATHHVTAGFAHPLDSKYSTAGVHTQMVFDGIKNGFINPIGNGLGSATLGASKFGGDSSVSGSAEFDVSDLFQTTGFVGGFLYLGVLLLGFMGAFQFVRTGPRILSFPVLAMFTCMLGAWIPLGQYALGPLLWFGLGFLDRRTLQAAQAKREMPQPSPKSLPPSYSDIYSEAHEDLGSVTCL